MKHVFKTLVLSVLLATASPPILLASDVLDLEIGDPGRKHRQAAIVLDAITDASNGELLSADQLAPRLADVRLLLVGESHTEMDFHRVQLRVIQELHRAGRTVLIGLEMYPYTEQEHLDRWIDGLYTEDGFVEVSDWYRNWGYHWDYYREIFLYARKNGLRMVGINSPRDVVSAVRKKGFENLTEEEAAHIPPTIDTDDEEHRELFRAYFDTDDPLHGSLTDDQWDGMLRAQCTWDATMAYNAVRSLDGLGGDAILVVLVGAGHVAYGLGIERQAALWSDVEVASLIPIPIRDEERVARAHVQASYADLVWGLPPYTEPLYPTLGISFPFGDSDASNVIMVSEGSVGERAGFEVGDVLLAMDGEPAGERGWLRRKISEKRWGDSATFDVDRGGETIELVAYFRRLTDEDDENDDNERSDEEGP